jgi:hypothetical protein
MIWLVVLMFLLGSGSSLWAKDFYQWQDDQGVVHLTDDLQNVPERYRDRVREITLPDEKSGPSEAPPAPPTTEGQQGFQPPEETDSEGHNREWWRNRIEGWRETKAEAEQQLADARERLNTIPLTLAEVTRAQKRREIQLEIETYEKQIQEADRMLKEVLPEEARKAGAPPGWLRE